MRIQDICADTVAEAIGDAVKLDRSSLGAYACDVDCLGHAMATSRLSTIADKMRKQNKPQNLSWAHSYYKTSDNILEDAMLSRGIPLDDKPLIEIEARFWDGYTLNSNTPMWMREHLAKLVLITSHPINFHDYYAHDIWDVEAISRFITDGVDAELAAVVLR